MAETSQYKQEARTLGAGNLQASPGDHKHDGTTSKKLMTGITISGSKGGNAALADLITKLAAALGFTDATT
jgi:chemotaxis response regulator CheB